MTEQEEKLSAEIDRIWERAALQRTNDNTMPADLAAALAVVAEYTQAGADAAAVYYRGEEQLAEDIKIRTSLEDKVRVAKAAQATRISSSQYYRIAAIEKLAREGA